MASCLIGLGANLDEPEQALRTALQRLDDEQQIRVAAHSEPIWTRPIGPPGQGLYCNAAAALETTLSAERLLQTMHRVEAGLGRRRESQPRWGPRAIDLDLLLFDDLVTHDIRSLIVPHPWMLVRRFVMQGAAQLAPQMIHSLVERPLGELLSALDAAPACLALCGGDPALRREVALQSQREILAQHAAADVAPLEDPQAERPEGADSAPRRAVLQAASRQAKSLIAPFVSADPPPAAIVLLDSMEDVYAGRLSPSAQLAVGLGRPLLIVPPQVTAAAQAVAHVWSGLQPLEDGP